MGPCGHHHTHHSLVHCDPLFVTVSVVNEEWPIIIRPEVHLFNDPCGGEVCVFRDQAAKEGWIRPKGLHKKINSRINSRYLEIFSFHGLEKPEGARGGWGG